MANVPVFCESCGTLFLTQSIIGGDTSGVTVQFQNSKFGPCPNCGEMGKILDGTFKFIDDSIHLLSGPQFTKDQLTKLSSILKQAQQGKLDAQELKNELDQKAPEFSSLKDLLPTNRNELYAFITMLLAVVGVFLQATSSGEVDNTDIEINQVINNIPNQTEEVSPPNQQKDSTKQIQPGSTSSDSTNYEDKNDDAG